MQGGARGVGTDKYGSVRKRTELYAASPKHPAFFERKRERDLSNWYFAVVLPQKDL